MEHQTSRRPAISTRLDQLQLPTTALLSWCPKKSNTARKFRFSESGSHGKEGGETGARDEVVSAGMADTGEGVVLGIENDQAAACADLG